MMELENKSLLLLFWLIITIIIDYYMIIIIVIIIIIIWLFLKLFLTKKLMHDDCFDFSVTYFF